MSVPDHLKYTSEHEWLNITGDTARVGITAFAAGLMGDIIFVQLPTVGDSVGAGEICGEVESTKSVSDLYAPADGEVLEVNEEISNKPELINSDAFGAGWLFTLKLAGTPDLLDPAAYREHIEQA